ncbi:TPA: hypothetical protein DCF80_01145 [Candidatus Saccharibacteria bacterium]|nr:hypothetical protein [Candidatus Saccharibacteria bacterium]HRK40615.1 hypothetical protein [Candidatus Saccharibacteria bacterium]
MRPHQNKTSSAIDEQKHSLIRYGLYMGFSLLALLVSRTLLVAVLITLLLPIIVILAVPSDATFQTFAPIVFAALFWPAIVTGRSEITEQDFGLIVTGWAIFIAVISFILPRTGLKLRIRFRHILLAITLLFMIALLVVVLVPSQPDRGPIATILAFAFAGCVFATSVQWALQKLSTYFRPT